MECIFCKNGHTFEGETTLTLQRNQAIILIKNVPAQICNNCDEAYLSAEVNQIVLDMAEDVIKKGAPASYVPLDQSKATDQKDLLTAMQDDNEPLSPAFFTIANVVSHGARVTTPGEPLVTEAVGLPSRTNPIPDLPGEEIAIPRNSSFINNIDINIVKPPSTISNPSASSYKPPS